MQSVKWVTFGISNALTRTVVHFFPSEGGVTAPYPASCSLRVFGAGIIEKRVVIEGARLSHPDGVRVEDAFPALKSDGTGIFGLEIEVETLQPRIDISASGCVVELASKGHSARFWPKRLLEIPTGVIKGAKAKEVAAEAEVKQKVAVAPILKDSFSTTSLVVVNGSGESFRPNLCAVASSGDSEEIPLASLSEGNAAETNLEEGFFQNAHTEECTWGTVRSKPMVLRDPSSYEGKGVFLMYRDALTRRPVSVYAL